MATIPAGAIETPLGAPEATAIGTFLLWALHHDRSRPAPEVPDEIGVPLAHAALAHKVGPSVSSAIREAGLDANPMLEHAMALSKTVATAQYLQVLADLPVLSRAMDRAGSPWALMKGPVIAHLGYGDPSLRGYVDLDVLVPVREMAAVVQALCAGGATIRPTNWDWSIRTAQSEIGMILPNGTHLDLHWHPVNNAKARRGLHFEVDRALARVRPLTMGPSAQAPVFDPADNLLTVAVHDAWSGGHLLGWSKDIERLTTADAPDWDELMDRARAAKVRLPVALMLRRSTRLLGAPVPDSVARRLVRGHVWSVPVLRLEQLATPLSLGRQRVTAQGVIASARDSLIETSLAAVRAAQDRMKGAGPGWMDPGPVDPSDEGLRRYLRAASDGF